MSEELRQNKGRGLIDRELADPAPTRGWSGGAKVLGKLPVPGRPTILITVGQGPTALAVGAGGGCLDIFTLIYPFSSLSPSLWETARYRLKYCLKGPLNPTQPTNRPHYFHSWPSQGGTSILVLHGCFFFFFFFFFINFLWSASIVATCIAAHFALCSALY